MAKRPREVEVPRGGAVLVRARADRAFLVTMHDAGAGAGASYVAVQAAHTNRSHRFTDLASAFRYLEGLTHLSDEEARGDIADQE